MAAAGRPTEAKAPQVTGIGGKVGIFLQMID